MNTAIFTKYLGLFLTFSKIGLFSFGGGNGIIEIIRYNTVDMKGWVTLQEFNLITGVSIALPGLNALNISCIIGYKVAGIVGAIISMLALVLPSLIVVVTFYELMLDFMSSQALKSFETIMQYAVIVLVAKFIYTTSSNLIYQDNISFILTILSIAFFIALTIFKLDTLLCLIIFITVASFANRL